MCGAYYTLFGPGNSAVLLWRHSSLDVAQNLRANWQEFVEGKLRLFARNILIFLVVFSGLYFHMLFLFYEVIEQEVRSVALQHTALSADRP